MAEEQSAQNVDFTCPIDVEEWNVNHRATVFPGQVNRWILVRNRSSSLTEKELMYSFMAALNKWLARGIFFDPGALYDGVKVLRTSQTRLTLPAPKQTRDRLPLPLPTVKADDGKVMYLDVSFNYRGHLSVIPWPVYTFGILESESCPINAEWMLLESSLVPLGDIPIEPELNDAFKPYRKPVEDAIKKPLDFGLDIVKTLLIGAVGIVGLSFILNNRK